MKNYRFRIAFGIVIALLIEIAGSCVKDKSELEWSDLLPILSQNNLSASEPLAHHHAITDVEAVDSELYGPVRGATLFLESPGTADSQGMKPRYWLRVEDYQTVEMALKRASEYDAVGTYERIETAYRNQGKAPSGENDSFILSKTSVRMWALARGRRVYALTTDTSLFTYLETPKRLRKAIEMLPEM